MQLIVIDCTANKLSESVVREIISEYPEVALNVIEKTQLTSNVFNSNSIMLVFSETEEIEDCYKEVINNYKAQLRSFASILPIAMGEANRITGGLEDIKALKFNSPKSLANLKKRVGACFGLRTIAKENQIFISYTVRDGTDYAVKVESYLKAFGFNIWRDETRDEDNEGKITVGEVVQKKILKAVEDSNLVLVVDTAGAPRSKWIGDEIDHANEHLVPIIPLCIRKKGSLDKGAHIRKLRYLNRYLEADFSLSNLEDISDQIFTFLSEVYKRKRELPRLVADKFLKFGFSWKEFELQKLLYEASKKHNARRTSNVLSHFTIYEGPHNASLDNYVNLIENINQQFDKNLFVFDGPMLEDHEIEAILTANERLSLANIAILHHEHILEFLG